MIDLYFAPTANGLKISIMLEEAELPYRVVPMDLERGDQRAESFAAINPNQKIPAIVDGAPADGGPPLAVFESGAILMYLADRSGRLLATEPRARLEAMQWLFWQTSGLGPSAGQAHHFMAYAPEKIAYAIKRFSDETLRLCGVLERRLADRQFLAGEYSIADIGCWTWITGVIKFVPGFVAKFPNVGRWHETIGNRPAVKKGLVVGRAAG